MRRRRVYKSKSIKKFRRNIGKTKVMNIKVPGRGGYRI